MDAKQAVDVVGTPLQNFGVAVGMLSILVLALGCVFWFFAVKILLPALARHFQFLDKLESRLEKETETLARIGSTLVLLEHRIESLGSGGRGGSGPQG